MIIKTVLILILIYFCLFFLIPLLILPNMLIIKPKIRITNKIKRIVYKLRSKNKEKTLINVFDYIKKHYSNELYNLFILANRHFYYDVDKLVDKKMFLGCHVQNLVLRTLLLATGQFSEKDLKKKIIMNEFGFLHQYYIVNAGNSIFKVDPFHKTIKSR